MRTLSTQEIARFFAEPDTFPYERISFRGEVLATRFAPGSRARECFLNSGYQENHIKRDSDGRYDLVLSRDLHFIFRVCGNPTVEDKAGDFDRGRIELPIDFGEGSTLRLGDLYQIEAEDRRA